MKKFFALLKKGKRKLITMGAVATVGCLSAISCFAEEVTSGTTTFDAGATSIFQKVTGSVNIGNIVTVLLIAIPACVGLFLFWWGGRKLLAMIMKAFRKGRVSI